MPRFVFVILYAFLTIPLAPQFVATSNAQDSGGQQGGRFDFKTAEQRRKDRLINRNSKCICSRKANGKTRCKRRTATRGTFIYRICRP